MPFFRGRIFFSPARLDMSSLKCVSRFYLRITMFGKDETSNQKHLNHLTSILSNSILLLVLLVFGKTSVF